METKDTNLADAATAVLRERVSAELASDIKAWRKRKSAGEGVHARVGVDAITEDARLLAIEGPRYVHRFAASRIPVSMEHFIRLSLLLEFEQAAQSRAIKCAALKEDAFQDFDQALSDAESALSPVQTLARDEGGPPDVLRAYPKSYRERPAKWATTRRLCSNLWGLVEAIPELGFAKDRVVGADALIRRADEALHRSRILNVKELYAAHERAGAHAVTLARLDQLARWATEVDWGPEGIPPAFRLPKVSAVRRAWK